MILGLTGTNGAGKAEVVRYLVQHKNFTHISNSGYLAVALEKRGEDTSRTNLRAIGNEFRKKYGASYLVDIALKRVHEEKLTDVVIESIRSTGEAGALKNAGGLLLVVDADRKIRYERIFKRGSGKDNIDYDTFVEQEEREWYGSEGEYDMNIRRVMDMADGTIMNNGSLNELHVAIDATLENLKKA